MRQATRALVKGWLLWQCLVIAVWSTLDPASKPQVVLGDSGDIGQLPQASVPDYTSTEAEAKWKVKTPLELRGKVDTSRLNKTLVPLTFQPLPLGSIKPQGWFREQLQLMADGLPGHMHEFYRVIKNATWLEGEEEYSALNEAWPYYINGLIPLAFGLDDDRLKLHVRRQVDRVLQLQQEDGWLGPETNAKERNLWGRYPFFLGLTQLAEATEGKERQKIVSAMHMFVSLMHQMLKDDYQGYIWKDGDQFNEQWGRSRAADMIMALQWLYEKEPQENGKKILENMAMLYEMSFDWSYWYGENVFVKEDLDSIPSHLADSLFPYLHGVNAGQGLKFGAVVRRFMHNETLVNVSSQGVEWLFKYHGTPSGAIIADERLSGLSPVRGTELCSVVETMFSLSYLYHSLGDKEYADRMELAAFNALPTMVMPRWWAHQYVAQTNQPLSHELAHPPFWNVGAGGQTFGLEPHYPCCTVQFSQGYPKLLSASWIRTNDNGIAHAILVPSEVKFILQAANKKNKKRKNKIRIKCKTNYPFTHFLTYTVDSDYAFDFSFRIPSWTNVSSSSSFVYVTTTATPNSNPERIEPHPHHGLHTIHLPSGHSIVEVSLYTNELQIHARPNKTIAISHGALLYAHSPHHQYVPHRPSSYPGDAAPPESNDWTIHPREGDIWNIAIDPNTLRFYQYGNRYDQRLPNPIWADDAAPISISALACPVDWKLSPVNKTDGDIHGGGYAESPPLPGQRNCTGRAFAVELQPYGSAAIRIAEFPTVDLSPGSKDLWDPFEESRRKGKDGERTEL